MIQITFNQATGLKNNNNIQTKTIIVKKNRIFIGKGSQLQKLKNSQNQIIDLNDFDYYLSRIHACILFSPAWFNKQIFSINKIFKFSKQGWQNLPSDTCQLIDKFIQPKKQCIVKDMNSRIGIFTKIQQLQIQQNMLIEFVHGLYLKFHSFQKCLNFENLQSKLIQATKQGYIILGNINYIQNALRNVNNHKQKSALLTFIKLGVKQTNYIILTENDLILKIGRQSFCQIQIKDKLISRNQAYLKCQNYKWKIIDGHNRQASKNGTWKKQNKIQIPITINDQPYNIKIGSAKCQIKLYQNLPWIDVQSILTDQDISSSYIQMGMQKINLNIHD